MATEALSDDTARPATERLAGHYDPARRGAGTTFLELPRSTRPPSPPLICTR
ncbi:hypothetical protein [Blastococcus brunescens]|uniref:Uncharacterized protein n=1 Tax=Blastococcus brunescens TaxID=1564165 RepID=A0ABZ1AV13_9ACTN|nr:hypothetical protein [Blastococcus sp. BMG 8361]WRL62411.1 hypothetical protein U6N30_20625 [Blastococcus sp. BMG 8361]